MHQILKAMMTKEEVAQVIAYCDENKISYKQRLSELGISPWSFYDAKRKYAPKEEGDNAGEFIQLIPGGSFLPNPIKPSRSRSSKQKESAQETVAVNIELKTGILWYEGIEKKTLDLVAELGMQDRIIYSSFNHYSIAEVRRLAPEAQTAYLFGDIPCDIEQYAAQRGVGGLHPGLYCVRMGHLLRTYLDSGLAVRVWTVNGAEDLRWLMEEGADVITNDPKLALTVRDGLAE